MLDGKRVLIVEDEAFIALDLETELSELGMEIAGNVRTVSAALAIVKASPLNIAVLDVNLDGETSYRIAEELQRIGVPFLFTSGYGADDLDPQWSGIPIVGKPFDPTTVANAIRERLQTVSK